MALIRIEPKLDQASGRYRLEIFHPHDAASPFVTTEPRYASAAAAETDLIAIIAAAASSAPAG
jgi:hypothetical protein